MTGGNEAQAGGRELARLLTQELMEALWVYQHSGMTGAELLAVWRREAVKLEKALVDAGELVEGAPLPPAPVRPGSEAH